MSYGNILVSRLPDYTMCAGNYSFTDPKDCEKLDFHRLSFLFMGCTLGYDNISRQDVATAQGKVQHICTCKGGRQQCQGNCIYT